MIWGMDGHGYDSLPKSVSRAEVFPSEVVDVFRGVNGAAEYARFRLYATEEVLDFGIFNDGMIKELGIGSTGDLVGRNYRAYVRKIEGANKIIAVEAVDFSKLSEKEIDRLVLEDRVTEK